MADSIGNPAKLIKTVDYHNAVHYKSGGSTGTRWSRGTWQDPCGSLANIRTMLTARKLDNVFLHSATILDADMTGINWFGSGFLAESIDINGKSVNNAVFNKLLVSGIANAAAVDYIEAFSGLLFLNTNPITLNAFDCIIFTIGGLPLKLAGGSILKNCHGPESSATVTISQNDTGGINQLSMTGWKGHLAIEDLVAGADVGIDGVGTLSVSGTGGAIEVRGDIKVTDLSGGLVTINDQTSCKDIDNLKKLDDGVYFDSALGSAGTNSENGRAQNPSNTIADVITMCAARKVKKIYVSGSVTLDADIVGYTFIGINKPNTTTHGSTVDLGGKSINTCHFYNCMIKGTQGPTGTGYAHDCVFNGLASYNFDTWDCSYVGGISGVVITPRSGSINVMINPSSCTNTITTAFIDFTGSVGTSFIIVGAVGKFGIKNSADASNRVVFYGAGASLTSIDNTLGAILNYSDSKLTDSGAGITIGDYSIYAVVAPILVDTGVMEPIISSLPTRNITDGTVTTDGNEQDVYKYDAPPGTFKPVCVKIDFTNHTVTESVTLRTYYRIKTGGNYILQNSVSYVLSAPDPLLVNIDLEPNRWGVKVTIEKTAGTNRAYDWEAVWEE